MKQHTVITGELKSKIDSIWNAFWSFYKAHVELIEEITADVTLFNYNKYFAC